MLIKISSVLWIITTLFLIISAIFLSFYYKFTNYKVLKCVNHFSKEDIKTMNISLAGKIGVGSISGIALSIMIGGKGTLFWIWISSFLFSIFTYLETKAGVIYRESNIGGPSLYIKNVLRKNRLSILYSLFIIITFLFSFILIQSNTILITVSDTLLIDKVFVLLFLIILVLYSINNGINRITKLVSYLVPIMSILYLGIGFYIVLKNYNIIPSIIIEIIKDGLNIKSILSLPLIIGFQRSIFSNEFGMGTTSMVVALSNSSDYNKEYFYQSIGMYYISLVVCTISAFIILTCDYTQFNVSNINGIEIINYAFNYHFNEYGMFISSAIITLFAFSTIITSFYYGDLSIKLLFKNKKSTLTKIIVIIVLILSLYIKPINIWTFVDISTSLTTIINVYALIKIRKKLKER